MEVHQRVAAPGLEIKRTRRLASVIGTGQREANCHSYGYAIHSCCLTYKRSAVGPLTGLLEAPEFDAK
jgi:hypothetical protein